MTSVTPPGATQRVASPIDDTIPAEASRRRRNASRRLAEETIEQGEQVKKISSWAAILFTPTLIASVYGMSFDHVPELHRTRGYPFAVALMVSVSFGVGIWGVFKWRRRL